MWLRSWTIVLFKSQGRSYCRISLIKDTGPRAKGDPLDGKIHPIRLRRSLIEGLLDMFWNRAHQWQATRLLRAYDFWQLVIIYVLRCYSKRMGGRISTYVRGLFGLEECLPTIDEVSASLGSSVLSAQIFCIAGVVYSIELCAKLCDWT